MVLEKLLEIYSDVEYPVYLPSLIEKLPAHHSLHVTPLATHSLTSLEFSLQSFYLIVKNGLLGLIALHGAGYLHCDISSDNVLYDEKTKRVFCRVYKLFLI